VLCSICVVCTQSSSYFKFWDYILIDIGKISESFLKQDSYKEELTASLEEVSKNSDRIQDEANQCLAWRQLQQEGMLLQVNNKADEQLHLLQSIMYLLRANPVLAANTAGKPRTS
jgi:hypothetical protein